MRMRSRTCAWVIFAATFMIAGGLNAAENSSSGNGELSPDTRNCSGPASTPACAARTWSECRWNEDVELCAKVGVKDIVFIHDHIFDENGNIAYPPEIEGRAVMAATSLWGGPKDSKGNMLGGARENSSNLGTIYGSGNHILGVLKVGPERFNQIDESVVPGYQVPFNQKGTYEVLIGHEIYQSLFFKEIDGRWVFVSYATESPDCEYGYEVKLRADCRLQIPIKTWDRMTDPGQYPIPE